MVTSRNRASGHIRKSLDKYLTLTASVAPEDGRRPVWVPPMIGIDEDMRGWSFFGILEHNVIVNRSITEIVKSLVRGQKPAGEGAIDMKNDVMPSTDPGGEQIEAFRTSVEEHLESVSGLRGLRQTSTKRHPVFGELNAHGWHCMFGLHLDIHRKQAEAAIDIITQSSEVASR